MTGNWPVLIHPDARGEAPRLVDGMIGGDGAGFDRHVRCMGCIGVGRAAATGDAMGGGLARDGVVRAVRPAGRRGDRWGGSYGGRRDFGAAMPAVAGP
ncbi:hypothetical protein HLH26_10260 [Gluconacetobacter sp. 1b LMG 1731]|uniref:Uncharacterized protein n=1 Tax=Gluconacetobacter dulcium TaxID=2729096 RepID=A0A7W4IL84_9PROT|nr:hypothetical protein [Gluconacetobacter dulcium]MBB2164916.1 hypothetical protein [Gluconacetobacter dulcium]MBB2194021.1 hypothetical protein [Gluconacetobacter dulcium]